MSAWNPERNALGQFKAGQGGRPKGARNRAGQNIRAIFEKKSDEHLEDALEELRQANPRAFVGYVLQAIPRPTYDTVNPYEQLTTEQLQQLLREHALRMLAGGMEPLPGQPPAGGPDGAGGGNGADGLGAAPPDQPGEPH